MWMGRFPAYILAGACGCGALWYAANRAIYYPVRFPEGYWELQSQVKAEDVVLRTVDGVGVHGWWLRQPEAQVVTLFLHGNAGNITHRIPHLLQIAAAGSSILIIDYRGYGKSEGRPTERGLYADADAGYEFVARQGLPVVLHGESLGTAVAVDLAARRPCAAVVLEAPFTSAGDIAAEVLPLLGRLLIRGYSSMDKVDRIHASLFFIHGGRDTTVPIRVGRALFEQAPQPKSFWTVPGAGHNDLVETAGPEYTRRLREFYGALIR